jgi:hypothetical protein
MTITINVNKQVDNLIQYYKYERATSYEGEVIIPSKKFCLELIIENEHDEAIKKLAEQRLKEEIATTTKLITNFNNGTIG